MLYTAFPSLSKELTPVAIAHGLKPLELPPNLTHIVLTSSDSIDLTLAPLLEPLDRDEAASLCVSLDAEWNISRTCGVSILQLAPHVNPSTIYIIPVHRFARLPTSLLRLLIHDRIFKIGSGVKGDSTRLKKQFPQQLGSQTSFVTIDLKDFALQRKLLDEKESGGLDRLCAKILGIHLVKDDDLRKHDLLGEPTTG